MLEVAIATDAAVSTSSFAVGDMASVGEFVGIMTGINAAAESVATCLKSNSWTSPLPRPVSISASVSPEW
jgi:hypothetical protein